MKKSFVILTVILAIAVKALALSPSGLVAAYSFNENTGTTVTDMSGNGNNGTINGAIWATLGRYGSALIFDGIGSTVTISNSASLQLTTGMTLEAWINPSTAGNTWSDVIYKGNDNYYLEAASDNSGLPAAGGTFSASPLYGTSALAAGTWTHLAVTYDGATNQLYVNGVQVASRAQTGNIATSTNPLQIGGDSFYGQLFQGMIDEVRVYSVALTAAQIQSDMNTPVGSISLVSSNTINVNFAWDASTGPTVIGYNLYYGPASYVYTNHIPVIGNVTSATASNLIVGTVYYFNIKAVDYSGVESIFDGEVALGPGTTNGPPGPPVLNTLQRIK